MKIQMNKGTLFVVTGPSGAGKGTVLGRLLKETDNIFFSVSATTRAPREGEQEGVNYYYVTKEQFESMIEKKQLLEYTIYAGNYYGTPKAPVYSRTRRGEDVVLEIELQGAMNIKKKCKNAVFIFLAPPSMEELERRLRLRGTEDEEHIMMRLKRAKEECAASEMFDHIVVNDQLDAAVNEMKSIVMDIRNKKTGGNRNDA